MAAATTLELFRASNTSGPRFDYLRPGEVIIFQKNGQDWVEGRTGGASTLEAPRGLKGTWYRLPQATPYDDSVLYLCNDYANHWSWQPDKDMPLAVYVAELDRLNANFIRV